MIRTDIIRVNEAWGGMPDAAVTNSFAGVYSPARISGPARFLRLLYGGGLGAEGFKLNPSNVHGCYWFAEGDVLRIKEWLDSDLKKGSLDHVTYLNRMAVALRNELRQQLAICRNFSPRFDSFARLTVPPQKSVAALVGTARGQRAYSLNAPHYSAASAKDTKLSGGLTQYVMRFDIPANAAGKNWIQEGLCFDALYR